MVVRVVAPDVMTTDRPAKDIEPLVPELPRTLATDGGERLAIPRAARTPDEDETEAPLVPDVR